MERKLAAILAADVVGYSRLMEQDEAKTFERLKDHRIELVEPEIAAHHGCVFKLMGDGLLAEFGSVVDAVECAVDIQRGMAERNAGEPEDHRIDIRIGINLGEVIVEGADRHGEGVNIAARLQQLADPGGICVSGKVAKEVEKKLAFGFEPMGEQKVKNISEPISVYRVKVDGRALPARRKNLKSAMPAWAMPVFAAIVLVLGGTATAWHGLMRSPTLPLVATHVPSIAVLPFDDLSADKSSRLSGRRDERGHHHHAVAFSRSLGDRAQLVLHSTKASRSTSAKSAAISMSTMRSKAASARTPIRFASPPSSLTRRRASTSGPSATTRPERTRSRFRTK